MKERPIPFSAPMVRALLAGTKTQTRRAMRGFCPPNRPEFDSQTGRLQWFNGDEVVCGIRSPYGDPGDRLWVREAHRFEPGLDRFPPREIPAGAPVQYEAGPHADVLGGKLRPAMFMMRWASRITLEVTEARVERLQDISEADALAEGIRRQAVGRWFSVPGIDGAGTTARAAYALLWQRINGPGSWEANPWVWCVSFQKVKP